MDEMDHRVLALRVEAGREGQPHLHGRTTGAFDGFFAHLAELQALEQRIVEALQPLRFGTFAQQVYARRVGGAVGRDGERVPRRIEALHPAATEDRRGLGGAVQRQFPQVVTTAVFGGEAQRAAVRGPLQRRIDRAVPTRRDQPPCAIGGHHGRLGQRRVVRTDMRRQHRQRLAVGRVSRRAEVPVDVIDADGDAAGAQVDLGDGAAVAEPLFVGRVETERDAAAVGAGGVGLAASIARQLEGFAFEQAAHTAVAGVEKPELLPPALRDVVVPVAVVSLVGDVGGVFPGLVGLVRGSLRRSAFRVGPGPGGEHDPLAVGQPFERFNARRKVAGTPRFAAVGRQQVQLRGVVLLAGHLALGDEGDL